MDTLRARRRAVLPLLLAPLLAGLAAACSDAPTSIVLDGPVALDEPWQTATPEAVGMDAQALDEALDRAAGISRLRSMLVLRRGRLVAERYFGDAHREDLEDVRSVTKSVVSTLVGLAVARGELEGLDQTLGELLPPDVADLDEVEKEITVRNLLTMSGGWSWTESGSVGYNEWITSPDKVVFLLEKPHAATPGTTFTYNSASAHLLGLALRHAVGRDLRSYAQELLLGPLGITDVVWETLESGQRNGGAGLALHARDLARLGQLFLQDGMSGNRRILPEGWVAEATAARYPWSDAFAGTHLSYGYLWWTDEDNDAFLGWGYGGQFIYVAPARELVVVTTTTWWHVNGESLPPGTSSQLLNVIVTGVLPAAPLE